MDALIMAGGQGMRMGTSGLKPLTLFKGHPLIHWVYDAARSCPEIDRIFIAITQESREIQRALDCNYVMTPGANYVDDMVQAVRELGLGKTMVLSADMPLLTSEEIAWVLGEYEKSGTPAMAVFLPLKVIEDIGLEPSLIIDGLVPAGVNVVDGRDLDGEETRLITKNPCFAFNINTPVDMEKALQFEEIKGIKS